MTTDPCGDALVLLSSALEICQKLMSAEADEDVVEMLLYVTGEIEAAISTIQAERSAIPLSK